MTNTAKGTVVTESESTDLKAEAKSMLEEARSSLRDIRLTGLGLWDKANAQARKKLDSIKHRGEEKLNGEQPAGKIEANPEAGEAEKESSLYKKAMAAFDESLNQARAYGLASYEEAAETTQQLSDWLTRMFNDAGTELESTEDKPISRLGRNLEQTSKTLSRLSREIRESTQELLETAKSEGKDVDYELRKALFGRQSSLESRLQSFWKAIGLVNKQDMEEVNRKLVVLAASLENQLDEESKSLVYLNRRKQDRRTKQEPVEFEKRIHDRREEDRLAS